LRAWEVTAGRQTVPRSDAQEVRALKYADTLPCYLRQDFEDHSDEQTFNIGMIGYGFTGGRIPSLSASQHFFDLNISRYSGGLRSECRPSANAFAQKWAMNRETDWRKLIARKTSISSTSVANTRTRTLLWRRTGWQMDFCETLGHEWARSPENVEAVRRPKCQHGLVQLPARARLTPPSS